MPGFSSPWCCPPGVNRSRVLLALETAGVETRDCMPLVTQEIYRPYYGRQPENSFPAAWALAQRAFLVGYHPGLGEAELGYLAETLKTALAKAG